MKLLLFISHNGGASRRKAFDHIINGDVTVNGMVIKEPSHMIEPGEDKISLNGREILPKAYEYVMLHKPAGYVTTCEAQFDQWTVMSLLPSNLRHLRPVGRLDKDTEGLLLLTNDGELANRLAHPSFDVNKTYHVRVHRRLEHREKQRLEEGVTIEGFRTAPAEVKNITSDGQFSEFDLTIHEGHKHQVRLMCHEVGHDVVKLTRIAQGPLQLDMPKPGAWRPLTGEELAQLHAIGRTKIAPVFKSHAAHRRYSSNRDWHQGQAERPKDPRPRNEQGEYVGRSSEPQGERFNRERDRTFNRDARAPRPQGARSERPRGDRPWSGPRRDERPAVGRPSYGPRRDERSGSDRSERREYKPYARSERSSARPESRPGAYPRKPFGSKPSYGKPSPGKAFSSGPDPFRKSSGPSGKPSGAKPYGKKPFGKKPFPGKPFRRSHP